MAKKSMITKITRPDFAFEKKCDFKKVAGVDEAGCGPWAGPVVAASVIFHEYDENLWTDLNDSKKLSKSKREELYKKLTESKQLSYGIGIASVEEIDFTNIAKATVLAMKRAVMALPIRPEYLLIDGIRKPEIDIPFELIVKGDSKSLSIAAASIIAKVTRDEMMDQISKLHPEYGWTKNAGYGTALHQKALEEFGVTIHHRKSFAPIRKLIEVAA